MELWIRSTARTNLLKARFLTIVEGNNFYKENEWEYKGYTIANCSEQGHYELLGTYKTKERALEVLDEIQEILSCKCLLKSYDNLTPEFSDNVIIQPCEVHIEQLNNYVYEMPSE